MLPDWNDVQGSLTAAIRAALPLQLNRVNDGPIAGLGVHIDAYYGSAGLYLLPESTLASLNPAYRDSIGDWPISTDWNLDSDHSQAFTAHWGRWDSWFRDHRDQLDEDGGKESFRMLLQVACQAVREVDSTGFLDFPKAEGFKIIIAEHDEPNELAVVRYTRFLQTGNVVCHGDTA